MALFNNKYRIETTRLKNWDYGSNAAYFVTICTNERFHFFEKIENDEMILNDIGMIVHHEWLQTPIIRPDMNLTLGEFAVMPNHFHGIICIGENKNNSGREGMHPLSMENKNKFGRQSKNLGAIIGGFKSTITIQAHKIDPSFGWQERYHDHIIRNGKSYYRIQQYIINNPANWKIDKFYS